MKMIILNAIMSVLILTLNAQIKKGATFLGGNFSFASEEGSGSNAYDVRGIYILPVWGFAIKDNLIIGVDMLWLNNDNDVSLDANDLKQNIVGGGFLIRKYQQIAKTDFSIFIQGHLGVEFERLRQGFGTIDKTDTKTSSVNIYGYPGISYNLSNTLQLETGFNGLIGARYFHRKTTVGEINPNTSTANGFNLYGSLENMARFNVGFRLILNKKQEQKS